MTLLLNGTPAVIQADTAFDYIAKNSLFDNKDDYTLEITLPLKDCLRNRQIFGIWETVPEAFPDSFDCHLIEGAFRKTGVLKVLSVTRDEVKAQFIEQALGTVGQQQWESLSLCDLDFGSVSPDYRIALWDARTAQVITATDNHGEFLLRSVAVYAARAMGYTLDDSRLARSFLWQHLLVCNPVTPHNETIDGQTVEVWPLRDAMPDWTVKAFFENIENLLAVRVLVDAETAVIRIVPLSDFYNTGETVTVTPAEEHEAETLDEEGTAYWKDANLQYASATDADNAQWFIDLMEEENVVTHFASLAGISTALQGHMQPIAVNDPALGRVVYVDGWSYGYPGPPQDEEEQNAAFQRWITAIRVDRLRLEEQGAARQFGTQILEAEGYYFIVAEAQSDALYRIMRRVLPLGGWASSSATPGERSSSHETQSIAFSPVEFVTKGQRIPVIQTPERYNVDYEETAGNPALLYSILKKGEPKRYETLYVALYRESGNASLLWTYSTQVTEALLQSSDEAYPYFAAIGTSNADGIIQAPIPRFSDGVMLDRTSVNMGMPYATAVTSVQSVWEDLFPNADHPTPFPTLALDARPSGTAGDLSPASIRAALPEFDRTRKYTFRFLCRGMPDPKAVFVIRGHRYICLQLTAQVTADGISDLKKGEFYRLSDASRILSVLG